MSQRIQPSSPSRRLKKRLALHRLTRHLCALLLLAAFFLHIRPAHAYSVLTHEQIIDLLWRDQLRPLLKTRFPNATDADLREAHAYAYGGSLIQDIGYYPFGSHFFSNLVHYVRSGDFVLNMLSEAHTLDEYAFALGALSHYAADTAGHPAVNQSVALDFPKLRQKYGSTVTYEDSPKSHIRTEFGFDVAQVAKDRFTSDAYHDFIGFEVSRPLLERAFQRTYGLPLTDVLPNPDLAINTFRRSVSTFIPMLTKVAIQMKKDEILHDNPSMTKRRFLYHLSRAQFNREWGRQYRHPSFGIRLLAFFLRILPHVGPLSTLDVKVPNQTTEQLYMQSVLDSRDHYHADLQSESSHTLTLPNRDFDTGKETKAGEYALTDETYAELLSRLAKRSSQTSFAQLPATLKSNIVAFYQNAPPPAFAAKQKKKWAETQSQLLQIESSQPTPLLTVQPAGQP
ncbi:MAG TPA: zinc dependent phospholipase C family protein [Acidobacteriaceae bacterium]|nr:zinc dependent phospholipase C family protein [Acidobacteriaceae bacterium]